MKKARILRAEPGQQGHALSPPLQGFRAIPVLGRYRIVYRVRESSVRIVGAGLHTEDRNDVYATLERILKHGGELDPS